MHSTDDVLNQRTAIVQYLQKQIAELMAVYAFGSYIKGHSNKDSDLDLAILVAGYVKPEELWDCSNDIANLLQVPVDLLDFRAASTVMQYEILMTGEQWWKKNTQAEIYEAYVLSEKTALDVLRKNLIDDILKTGRVYGG